MSEIHVGDIGTVLTATLQDINGTAINISGYMSYMILNRPDNTSFYCSGTLVNNGTGGTLQYTTVSGDLNTYGLWRQQGWVYNNSKQYYTDVKQFYVYGNLG